MPKPKEIRQRMGQRAKVTARASAQPKKKETEKKSAIERIHEFARVREDPRVFAGHEAIIGTGGAMLDLCLANTVQMFAISRAVYKSILRHLHQTGQEWGIQTTHIGVVPGSAAEIDVPLIRKASRFYVQAGVDVLMVVTPGPVPLETDASGFGIALEARALVFGSDARSQIQRADMKTRKRRASGPSRSVIRWHDANDEVALRAELTNMFRPSLIDVPPFEGEREDLSPDGWDARQFRQLRGFVTLMIRSMLPLKKAAVLIGEGRSIAVGAITAAEVSMKKARRGSEPPVHPDGLPHFWFQELRRLGLDGISVPLVKMR